MQVLDAATEVSIMEYLCRLTHVVIHDELTMQVFKKPFASTFPAFHFSSRTSVRAETLAHLSLTSLVDAMGEYTCHILNTPRLLMSRPGYGNRGNFRINC